ncbi:MAG: hypothetical protein ACLFQQ_17210 [Desulfococcaceae bacterium]
MPILLTLTPLRTTLALYMDRPLDNRIRRSRTASWNRGIRWIL